MSQRVRNWCVTWNNIPDVLEKEEFFKRFKDLRYGCYQLEKGDETQKLHYQGYLEFSKAIRLGTLQKCCPGIHASPRVATRDAAREYCRKPETRVEGPFEFGGWSQERGSRTDLANVKRLLDEGSSLKEVAEEEFGTFVKYFKGIEAYMRLGLKNKDYEAIFEVHVGEPGTGKTTSIAKEYPDAYWKDATKWWEGYTGQYVVVLDEMTGFIPFHMLLRMHDATPLPVEWKGGFTQFAATRVVFASNKAPHEWYNYIESKLEWGALKRRIAHVTWHKKDVDPETYLDYDDFMRDWDTRNYVPRSFNEDDNCLE